MNASSGIVNATCMVDADCPAGLVCYSDVSWSPLESFCACSSVYGKKAGEGCEQVLGPGATLVLGLALVPAALRALLLMCAVSDLVRLHVVHQQLFDLNARNTTFFMCCVALATGLLANAALAVELLDAWTGETVVVFEDGHKEHYMAAVTSVSGLISSIFTFLMLLNLSVMWVEVSQRTYALQLVSSSNVSRYRSACALVAAVFVATNVAVLALGQAAYLPVVLLLFSVCLMAVIFAGRRGMLRVLEEAIVRLSSEGGAGSKQPAYSATRALLRDVARTSKWALVVSGVLALVCLVYSVTTKAASSQGLLPIDQPSRPALFNASIAFCIFLLQAITFHYCHRIVSRSGSSRASSRVVAVSGPAISNSAADVAAASSSSDLVECSLTAPKL